MSSTPPFRLRHAALAAILAGAALVAANAGSIVVAPTAVYMNHETRSAELTLFNPGQVAEEVVIETIFGFPATDAEGRLHLFVDAEGTDPRSAAGWLRAFPDRVVVPPGGRQVVRIFGDPPAELADGEYWARLVVTARGQSLPVQDPATPDIRVGLDLEVRTLLAATYRKGPIQTGLDVGPLEPRIEEGHLVLQPRIQRTGNGAWIGSLSVRILDAAGAERWSADEQVAVYETYHRRFAYPVEALPPGRYSVETTFATDRDDVPARFRLVAEPIMRQASFEIP
jgi:hypothetical protein